MLQDLPRKEVGWQLLPLAHMKHACCTLQLESAGPCTAQASWQLVSHQKKAYMKDAEKPPC